MNFNQLTPIEATRTDPKTGKEFTFTATPPDTEEDLLYADIADSKDTKEFIVGFFWRALMGEYDVFHMAKIKADTLLILPLLVELVYSINIHRQKAEEATGADDEFIYSYSLTPDPTFREREDFSGDFIELLLKEVLLSPATQTALSWYLGMGGKELYQDSDQRSETPLVEEETGKKTNRLYANSKTINQSLEFGLAKPVADNLVKLIKEANREKAINQYQASSDNPRSRKAAFRTEKAKEPTEFVFDQAKLAIKTAEKFADQLMKMKDAKVLQGFMGLIKLSNINDSPVFREVPISDVMEIVQKAQAGNKFNTTHRREFSEVLEYLDSVSMTVSIIGDQVNTKTGKTKPVLRQERGVKLFRMVATYSVKKEFQHIPKEALVDDIHFDKTVITRFSGELFPGNAHLFQGRANVYFDSLLKLDAKYDSKAIILGFQLQTRFNQMTDKERHLVYDRPFLVELCDYEKTNKTMRSKATKQIANNLNKLKEAGIISKYTGLTNNDEDRVFIYPPKSMMLEN